jgi:carbon monoxide dehydrogenase subunit G
VKVEGTRSFDAPLATVWEVLNDPKRMAKTMPGVESFEIADDKHWSAKVKIPLGLGGLAMTIAFEVTDERPPEYAKLVAKGQGVGALMNMATEFHLSQAETGTEMRWEADVKVAGPVGAMGMRVLQPIVNQQVKNVLAALDVQVQEAKAAGGDSGGAPAPSTETSSGTADPEPKDGGRPSRPSAETDLSEGVSGAEEGLSPWAPESYTEDPDGPTTSTEDRSD